jgi:hypothetical protein
MKAEPQRPPAEDGRSVHEPCDECGTPLDSQQRYCVNCAARRTNGANPSSRYFAAMSKRAHRPMAAPPPKAQGSRAAAVGFFALLPIAVAIGVVVGRSGSDGNENEALLQALRKQQATATAAAPAQTASATPAATKKGRGKSGPKSAKGEGKVIAHTSNGTVHQITGLKVSKEKEEEDTHLVESNVKQSGSTYIKAQQNLPDVIVVGGEPGSAPAPSGSQP